MAQEFRLTLVSPRPKRLIATAPPIDSAKVDGEDTMAVDAGGKQADSKTRDVENGA
jgi:hypothetical protein